jgi:tetratricopeptide (TPR) repeat protein
MYRIGKLRRPDLWKLLLLLALAGTAVYFWGEPSRHEVQLRNASRESLQTLVTQRPHDDRALFYLGLRQRVEGLRDAAARSFERAAQLRPSSEDVWLAWAETVLPQDRQRAYDLLNIFLHDFPESARARTMLASLYLSDLDFEHAYNEARKATTTDVRAEEAWRLAGRAAINRNQPDQAEEAMQKALALTPNNGENMVGLGNAYALRHRWNDALPLYDRAISLAPKEALPRYLKGTLLVTRATSDEDFKQAVEEFRQSIRIDPDLAVAYRGLGMALSHLRAWDDAQKVLEEARSRDPQDEAVAFSLARVYRELQLQAEAKAELARHSRLSAYHRDKQALYEKLALLDASSSEAATLRRQLAELMAHNGEEIAAIDQYRKLLRRNPEDIEARAKMNQLQTTRPATLPEARALLAQGRYENAESAFLTILERDKANALALEGVAVALKKQGKEEGAFLYALEAAKRKPDLAVAQQMLGDLYAKAKYYQEATFHYQKALEVRPNDVHSWRQLGSVLREIAGKDTEAADALQRAIALQPDEPLVRLDLAETLAALHKNAEAEQAFRDAMLIAPANEAVLARFSAFLIDTADASPARKQEAADLITRALALEPSDTFLKYQMARLTDDPKKAIPLLQEVITKATGTEVGEIWYALAKAYRRVGDSKRAQEAVTISSRIQSDYLAYVQAQEKVSLHPKDAALRLILARAYATRGENAKALQEYERCLVLAPQNKTAQLEKDSLMQRLKAKGNEPNMVLFRQMQATAQTGRHE